MIYSVERRPVSRGAPAASRWLLLAFFALATIVSITHGQGERISDVREIITGDYTSKVFV